MNRLAAAVVRKGPRLPPHSSGARLVASRAGRPSASSSIAGKVCGLGGDLGASLPPAASRRWFTSSGVVSADGVDASEPLADIANDDVVEEVVSGGVATDADDTDGDGGVDDVIAAAGLTPLGGAGLNAFPDGPDDLEGGEWMTDEFATSDDDEEGAPAPATGDVAFIPREVLEHVAAPLDFAPTEGDSSDDEFYGDFDPTMSQEDRERNIRRKKLQRMVEDPIPVPNRPMWPLYACVVQSDQVQNVTPGGMVPSTRTLVLVGNMHGAAGFGIGKHSDARTATKHALRNAKRDMIHVSTHNGQLYHDLIGKKNRTTVIVRSVPPSKSGSSPSLIRTVFEYMGIKNASAKIVGSKRRNRYQVVQALFDAFQHHTPPEDDAFKRGLRMQWIGSDRHNPRNYYPAYPKGPRHKKESYKKP